MDYFAYVSWVSGSSAVALGFSRIGYAKLYSTFSGTATNEKYAAFSTTPASSDEVEVCGRFAATLSAGAGYTWTVPSYTNTNLVQSPTTTTRELDWVPQFTAVGGGSFTPSLKYAKTQLISSRCFYRFITNAHTISGTVSSITYTLPFVDGATASLTTGDFLGITGVDVITNKSLYEQFITGGASHALLPIPSGNWGATTANGFAGVKSDISLI